LICLGHALAGVKVQRVQRVQKVQRVQRVKVGDFMDTPLRA
jgi:hypothetical protein